MALRFQLELLTIFRNLLEFSVVTTISISKMSTFSPIIFCISPTVEDILSVYTLVEDIQTLNRQIYIYKHLARLGKQPF